MTKATTISCLCCAVLLLVSVDAFCPTKNVIARSARSVVRASPDAQEQETATAGSFNNGLARLFAFTAASVFAFHPMATLAAPINVAEPVGLFASSSVQIAAVTKTVDMSMPSYGTISSPKLSEESFASLTVAPVKQERAPPKSRSKSKPKSESTSEQKPAFAAFLLPSMNKKGPAAAAADKAEKKGAVETAVVEKAAPKVSTPTYDF